MILQRSLSEQQLTEFGANERWMRQEASAALLNLEPIRFNSISMMSTLKFKEAV